MRVEQQPDTLLVALHGEFDLTCEAPFREQLARSREGHPANLVLDLCGLAFMDSVGVGMLVKLNRMTSEDGVTFTVLCGEGHVRRVLRETGLDGLLPVVDPGTGVLPASDSPV
jgi:anti-sigma B factor antagonist